MTYIGIEFEWNKIHNDNDWNNFCHLRIIIKIRNEEILNGEKLQRDDCTQDGSRYKSYSVKYFYSFETSNCCC